MRLINADELIKRFKELKGADSLANMFVTDVINEIKKQHTAYDVDKVVERLKKEFEKYYGNQWNEVPYLVNAIKIVKSGGIK